MTTWHQFRTANGLAGHHAGEGPTLIVVLHGGPGLTDYTTGMCDEVLAAGGAAVRVARYQQRGQAPSTADGPLDVAQFVDDVVAVIDHFGAAEAIVAGHSWGGHLAMHVGADRPDRVMALLLVDPLGAIGDGGSGAMGEVLRSRLGPDALIALDELSSLGLDPDEGARRELALLWPGYFAAPADAPPMPDDLLACASVGESVWPSLAARLDAGHLEERLPRFVKPVLYQIGTRSPIDPAVNVASAKLFPSVTVDEIDCGHFPWMERPGSVTAAMTRLLSALSGR